MIAMTEENPNIALLLINYNYESIGTYGPPTKIPAGGKSIKFYSSLTFFTSRKGWVEKTVAGEKVRVGADVIFKLDKNHLTKNSQGKKQITFRITKEGMDFLEAKEED
jgi:RecA/RadA recombinase